MKNKLTLKSLKQELENMKVKTGTKLTKTSKPLNETNGGLHSSGHDIKNSYIQRLYMRSSGFMLYLITGVLAYAHRIPYINRIIAILGAIYGRTTIWKLLSTLRKVFIVINAIIGVYIVFKTAGFSFENILMGWTAVGETYLQTLVSLTGKLFKWFVELFDHKVVPNVPGDNGGLHSRWFSKPPIPKNKSIFTALGEKSNLPNLIENDTFSLRNLYKDSTVVNSNPWYKDSTT